MPGIHERYLADAIRIVAGSMGHELNNQLTIILGNSGLTKRKFPEAAAQAGIIEEAADKIISKTKQLTTLASRMGGARAPIAIKEALESALAVVETDLAGLARVTWSIDVDPSLTVRMDASGLPSALYFCAHALRFDDDTAVTMNAAKTEADNVDITVTGSSHSLSDELAALAPSTADDILLGEDAVAIGLSAAKAFTHRCQGTLYLERHANGQAQILLRLPVYKKPASFLK